MRRRWATRGEMYSHVVKPSLDIMQQQQQQQPPFPIIFLDVDGVLHGTYVRLPCQEFDEVCMNYLCQIVNATGAKIVLSSTWRTDTENKARLVDIFNQYNLEIYDSTPYFTTDGGIPGWRWLEIKDWLDKHSDIVDRWIIIDDNLYAKPPEGEGCEYFIHTDSSVGLIESDKTRAIQLLTMQ